MVRALDAETVRRYRDDASDSLLRVAERRRGKVNPGQRAIDMLTEVRDGRIVNLADALLDVIEGDQ